MTRALAAELLRLRRPRTLLASVGLLAALAALAAALIVAAAGAGGSRAGGASVSTTVTLAQLSRPDGLATLFSFSGRLLAPLLALSLAAWDLGSDYRLGTIRLLLLQEPRRLRLLAGKLAALLLLVAVALGAALGATGLVGALLGSARGTHPVAWAHAAGAAASARALGNALALSAGWAAAGALLAVVTRSSVAALGIGLGWLLAAENLVAAAWDGARRWLPGHVLAAVGAGGGADLAYARAGALAAAYVAGMLALAGVVYRRRDVTD
jgi:hypothetical protein